MAKQNHKNREGVVYSTDQNFEYTVHNEEENETLLPEKQQLRISLDTKSRGGKKVTLITGFIGKTGDIEILAKELKNKCGVGGSTKDREIIIQGDLRDKILKILTDMNYKARKI
ncbi:MAG TPA: translation initiation factor [Cytophagaceae bacterium]|jgi:translation initiation factor 1|nr:translation initiation factor [Cytophagaceae bacterium]